MNTPITDAKAVHDLASGCQWVTADFARHLEREIGSLRIQLEGVLRANKGLAEKVKRLEGDARP